MLIPFFSVSDFTNSVFYRFRYLEFRFIFLKQYFWCLWFFVTSIWGHSSVTKQFFLEIWHPASRNANNVEPYMFQVRHACFTEIWQPPTPYCTALRNTWMAPLVVFLFFIWYSHVAQYLFGQLFDVWNVIKKINCFKHSFSILTKKFYSVTVLRWVTKATIPPSLCCAESTAVQVYHQCHHCSTAGKKKKFKNLKKKKKKNPLLIIVNSASDAEIPRPRKNRGSRTVGTRIAIHALSRSVDITWCAACGIVIRMTYRDTLITIGDMHRDTYRDTYRDT